MASHDSETPAQGQQVITAVAFIHKIVDGTPKVFLAKRASTKKFLPGLWELPGGHIDYGEDIVEGLKREIMEELGMQVDVHDPFAAFTYVNEVKGSHSIEVAYLAEFVGDDSNIKLDSEDHETSGWFSAEEITKLDDGRNTSSDPEFKVMQKGFSVLASTS